MSNTMSRRLMLRVLGAAGGTLALGSMAGCGGGADCSVPSGVDTSTRTALHYVPNATNTQRSCTNCTLYTAGADGCGTCQAFPGPVLPGGTCDSFVART